MSWLSVYINEIIINDSRLTARLEWNQKYDLSCRTTSLLLKYYDLKRFTPFYTDVHQSTCNATQTSAASSTNMLCKAKHSATNLLLLARFSLTASNFVICRAVFLRYANTVDILIMILLANQPARVNCSIGHWVNWCKNRKNHFSNFKVLFLCRRR